MPGFRWCQENGGRKYAISRQLAKGAPSCKALLNVCESAQRGLIHLSCTIIIVHCCLCFPTSIDPALRRLTLGWNHCAHSPRFKTLQNACSFSKLKSCRLGIVSIMSLFVVDCVICLSDMDLHFSFAAPVVSKSVMMAMTIAPAILQRRLQLMTYDLLRSPSRLKLSIIRPISFLPSLASTLRPPILILTFSSLRTMSSLFSRRCRMLRQTKTPQSDPFSCKGLSSSGMN
jgi:hypothetical protein